MPYYSFIWGKANVACIFFSPDTWSLETDTILWIDYLIDWNTQGHEEDERDLICDTT